MIRETTNYQLPTINLQKDYDDKEIKSGNCTDDMCLGAWRLCRGAVDDQPGNASVHAPRDVHPPGRRERPAALLVVKVDAGKHDFVPASAELKKAIAIGHRHGVFVNVFVGGDAGADETVYARLSELGTDAFGTERPDAFFAWLTGSGASK